MDIKQAKEEIRRAVLAYTERTPDGALCMPLVHQRPLLLMGPPGVGKTAVFYQLALGINLVSYTMTHHTRQSALGLPLIREKTFGGKPYSATEYTMSEILAASMSGWNRRASGPAFCFWTKSTACRKR